MTSMVVTTTARMESMRQLKTYITAGAHRSGSGSIASCGLSDGSECRHQCLFECSLSLVHNHDGDF